MADIDNPVTGKDTSIQLTQNGTLIQIQDQVTGFSVDVQMDEITTKNLGRSGSRNDQEFVGWKGSIDITTSTASADEFMDTIVAAAIARVPMRNNIIDRTMYRNGTSAQYTYPDCKFTFSKRVKRGESTTVTLNWMTGENRIAA